MKSHLFNVHDVILIMTMSQCILLAVFQSLLPTQSRVAHHVLTAFFVLIFLNTAGNLLLWNAAMQSLGLRDGILLPAALGISFLLKGPVLYFYLRSICEPLFVFQRKHVLHLMPAILAFVLIIVLDISGHDLLTGKGGGG